MESVNPKTGEVTVPKKPIRTSRRTNWCNCYGC
jgi:hypothetical protein